MSDHQSFYRAQYGWGGTRFSAADDAEAKTKAKAYAKKAGRRGQMNLYRAGASGWEKVR